MAGYTLHLKGVFFFQGRSIFCTSSPAAERWKQQTLFLDSLFITHTSSIFDTSPLKTQRGMCCFVWGKWEGSLSRFQAVHTQTSLWIKNKTSRHYINIFTSVSAQIHTVWTKTLSSLWNLIWGESRWFSPASLLSLLKLVRGISWQADLFCQNGREFN